MMKLGKKEKLSDRRTLQLSNYIDPAILPVAPKSYGWSRGVMDWKMFNNDKIGDCTIAAIAHQVMTWTNATGSLFVPPLQDIIKVYTDISGYDPRTGLNDNGCAILDVLKYFRNYGLSGHKIEAFAEVNVKNEKTVKDAIYIFGSIDIGVQLPITAQGAEMWVTTQVGPESDKAPGSWGGHSVIVTDYDDKFLRCVTWGNELLMTWDFFNTYCDEAYAEISADFIKNDKAPNGFAIQNLIYDLKKLELP